MENFLNFGENANFNTAGIKVWIAEANEEFAKLRKQNTDLDARLDALNKRITSEINEVGLAGSETAEKVFELESYTKKLDNLMANYADTAAQERDALGDALERHAEVALKQAEETRALTARLDALDDRLHNLEQGARLQEERHTALAKRLEATVSENYKHSEALASARWERNELEKRVKELESLLPEQGYEKKDDAARLDTLELQDVPSLSCRIDELVQHRRRHMQHHITYNGRLLADRVEKLETHNRRLWRNQYRLIEMAHPLEQSAFRPA